MGRRQETTVRRRADRIATGDTSMFRFAPPLRRPVLLFSLLVAVALGTSGRVSAATPPSLKITESAARQMDALRSVKVGKPPAQNKIDSRLYLALLHQRADARLALLTDFRYVK